MHSFLNNEFYSENNRRIFHHSKELDKDDSFEDREFIANASIDELAKKIADGMVEIIIDQLKSQGATFSK